jgi:anti-sigma factor RsiW
MSPPATALVLLVAVNDMSRRPVSCPDVLSTIQCYVDCECEVMVMLTIAAHLDACPACAAELATLRWLKAAVRRCGSAPESGP